MENSNIQQIEAYVRNQMNPDERRSFEEKMAGDPALRQEVEETMIIVNGIRYTAHQDLRRMAEKARDTYHNKAKVKKPQRLWLIITIVLVSAGLLWLGSLYFRQSGDTIPTEDSQEEINSGMASESTSDPEHDLSMSGKAALYSGNVVITNSDGSISDDSILVNFYRDETLTHTHYLLQEDQLNFYFPRGIDLSSPPVLFRRSDSLFIRTTTETISLIEDGALQILDNK